MPEPTATVSAATPCPHCGAQVHADYAFCQACGKSLGGRAEAVKNVVDGALGQVENVLRRPGAQKLAAGALLGAGAAVVVPFVTLGAGAVLGAAYAGWRLIRKD